MLNKTRKDKKEATKRNKVSKAVANTKKPAQELQTFLLIFTASTLVSQRTESLSCSG